MRTARTAALVWMTLVAAAQAGDWPTYNRDIRRSGVTEEQPTLPLSQAWVFKERFAPRPGFGTGYPHSTNWEGGVEKRRIDFDRADAAVAAGGKVYFGSVGDGKVYCLDAATGAVVWTFRTEGPVRLAPTIAEGKAYFGSDDGWVYCADAGTGAEVWKFRAAPDDHRVIGNGRLISLWPVRTGVLVDAGVAYFSAGILTSEGVFTYALDARTGKVVWKNDREGESRLKHISPQGYLLATDELLVLPMGRMAPGVYDRKTGDWLYNLFIYYGGGTYCTMYKNLLFSGWEAAHCFPLSREHPGKANYGTSRSVGGFPGGRLVYAGGMVYSCGLPKNEGVSPGVVAIPWQPTDATESDKRRNPAPPPAPGKGWTTPFETPESLILAGKVLFVGGKARLAALDAADGKVLWSQALSGTVLHLALADGRLYASTDAGEIYCFAASAKPAGPVAEPVEAVKVSPATTAAADAILKLAPEARKGFALVYGLETGELALELTRRTELSVVAVSPDAGKVAAARALLDKAGVYGGRAVVIRCPLEKLPFTPCFANLVVSETPGAGSPAEMRRLCTPVRGAVVEKSGDTWTVFKRPALPGAAAWTDQYGTGAACGTSDDDLVRAPFRVQWFGEPGYEHMVDRHYSGSSPLAADGRLFVATKKGVHAYDAYNGTELWFFPLADAAHPAVDICPGNAAIGPQGYFIAAGETLRLLEPETGKVLREYKAPPAGDGKTRDWGYLTITGDIIVGSRSLGHIPVPTWTANNTDLGPVASSDVLFGMDAATGKVLWTWQTEWFRSNTPAVADGLVFVGSAQGADGPALAQALAEKEKYLAGFSADAKKAAAKTGPWTMKLAALDLKTGQPRWQRIVDVSLTGTAETSLACKNGRLFQFSSIGGDKSFDGLIRGRWGARVIIARDVKTGEVIWMKNYDYRGRLAFPGDVVLAEPFALDPATGEQKTVPNPLTGQPTPWFFIRPYKNCGPFNASKHALFFRNDSIGYYDIDRHEGSATFDSHRPSCWMSFNSANGLASFTAGGAACRCPGTLQGTVVLVHDDDNRVYGDFSLASANDLLPVRALHLNLGAPGDRRDSAGRLWLAHPRQPFKGGFQLPVTADFLPGGAFTRRDSSFNRVAGTDTPWVFNSQASGLKSLTLQLRGPADTPASYKVTLLFAETSGAAPGQRVFDVKLQGKVVHSALDIVKSAGAPDKGLALTFPSIPTVAGAIKIDLLSPHASPTPAQWPTLAGLILEAQ